MQPIAATKQLSFGTIAVATTTLITVALPLAFVTDAASVFFNDELLRDRNVAFEPAAQRGQSIGGCLSATFLFIPNSSVTYQRPPVTIRFPYVQEPRDANEVRDQRKPIANRIWDGIKTIVEECNSADEKRYGCHNHYHKD